MSEPISAYCHPDYLAALAPGVGNLAGKWEKVLDALAGEETVKGKGEVYLPRPGTMRNGAINIAQAESGAEDEIATTARVCTSNDSAAKYNNYRARAEFPDWTARAAEQALGLLNKIEPTVELPDALAELKNKFGLSGEGIFPFISRVLTRQLHTGRVGVLLDTPDGAGFLLPHAILFYESNILNWHTRRDETTGVEVIDYLLLDESGYEFNGEKLQYAERKNYRVCALDGAGQYYSVKIAGEFKHFNLAQPNFEVVYPELRGRRLNFVPLVFFNVADNSTNIDRPPLSGIACNALSAYKLSADFRHSLYISGQATLFLKGVGRDAKINIGADNGIFAEDPNADARWLEITGSGLAQMAAKFDALEADARRMSVELVEGNESGKALNTRIAIKTASLVSIANTAQNGFKRLLEMIAEWAQAAAPEKIKVAFDVDFHTEDLDPAQIVQLGNLVDAGHLLRRDYWQYLRDHKWTAAETFEEWETETQSLVAN
jgi:hypothetical protein